MMKPTIHLNGTSANELCYQLSTVAEALATARVALCKAAPHGRDYYPQGNDAINTAIAEHNERFHSLTKLYEEIVELWEHVDGARSEYP